MPRYDQIKAMERVVRAADQLAMSRDARVSPGHPLPLDAYFARWGALVNALDEVVAHAR